MLGELSVEEFDPVPFFRQEYGIKTLGAAYTGHKLSEIVGIGTRLYW